MEEIKQLRAGNSPFINQYQYQRSMTGFHLNQFGYRSEQAYPIEGDYIVAFGCSHTFGYALEEEYRYSNLIQNTLNIPVINLGVIGTSAGFIKDNLLQLSFYLNKTKIKKPKFIIVQWPDFTRLWFGIHQNLRSHSFLKKEFLNTENLRKIEEFNLINFYHINLLCEIYDIKRIDFCLQEHWPEKELGLNRIKYLDFAEDNEHPGRKTNMVFHDYILERWADHVSGVKQL